MNFHFSMTQGTQLLINMLRNRIGFVNVTPTVLPPYHAVVLETRVIMLTDRLYFCVPSFVMQR